MSQELHAEGSGSQSGSSDARPVLLQWDGAPSEVQNHGPAFHARTYLIDRAFRRLRPQHLLDVGCGRGHVTAIAARHAKRVTATDLAPDAVAETSRRLASHRNAAVRVEDALAADVAESEHDYDAILLSEVLEHLKDDRGTLVACRRLLPPGGHLVITVPGNPGLWTQWDDVAGHLRRYRKNELVWKVKAAGFHVDRITNWGFPITGWLAIRGAKMRGGRVTSRARGGEVPALTRLLLPVASIPFRLLARMEPWLSFLDRGAGYVLVASVPQD